MSNPVQQWVLNPIRRGALKRAAGFGIASVMVCVLAGFGIGAWHTAHRPKPIPTDGSPFALAWDGSNLWAANRHFNTYGTTFEGTIQRIDPEQHNVIESIAIDGDPSHILWDGTSVWVATHDPVNLGQLHRIDPVQNVVTQVVALPELPTALGWDGQHVWVGAWDDTDSKVYQIDPNDGTIIRDYVLGDEVYPIGFAWDGTTLWVANRISSPTEYIYEHLIQQIDPVQGAITKTLTIVGTAPTQFVSDGTHLWVASDGPPGFAGRLQRLDPASGIVDNAQPIQELVRALIWDGASLWVMSTPWPAKAGDRAGTAQQIDPASGTEISSIRIATVTLAAVWDGSGLWVGQRDCIAPTDPLQNFAAALLDPVARRLAVQNPLPRAAVNCEDDSVQRLDP